MDISSLSGAYLDNMRTAGNMAGRNNAAAASDFADMLRRAAAQNAGPQQAESAPAPTPDPRSPFAVIDRNGQLYEQCVELEIFLVKTLISSMRNTVQKSGLIDEGFAGKMYEDMLYDEYARDFAINSKFGLAEMAYLELTGQRGKTVQR